MRILIAIILLALAGCEPAPPDPPEPQLVKLCADKQQVVVLNGVYYLQTWRHTFAYEGWWAEPIAAGVDPRTICP